MRRICVIGAGHVGLVHSASLAELGHRVVCLDIDAAKIENLCQGIMPIYEPGLDELVARNTAAGQLSFTADYAQGVAEAEIVFIAVDAPAGIEGETDLHWLRSAAESLARHLRGPIIIVNKSTVPIGTSDWLTSVIRRHAKRGARFFVVSNPEFLREGSAVEDCLHPDRVVLGSTDRAAAEAVADLYQRLDCPILITDPRTAEMIKYASNAFLATRISFINEIAQICEQLGADVNQVAQGMGYDRRIGHGYLQAGLGWGGSCFPKDVKALAHMAAAHGAHPQLVRAVMEINRDQRRRMVQKLRQALGDLEDCTIALLGLSFKPNTDDLREAPSLDLIRLLESEGAHIKAYDPVAMPKAAPLLPRVELCADAYAACQGSDALVIVTEWEEFRQLNFARLRQGMRQPILVDGRNMLDPEEVARHGLTYIGLGRPSLSPKDVIEVSASVEGEARARPGVAWR
ncbi:MAG: UDP-glucose/GDP-mannose dehydrogenase family protein [Chloroflexi bacterium]|nr:UDP-glucose/GDP-mannose dehydrogenase family protein [Chloroflexota bacterium]